MGPNVVSWTTYLCNQEYGQAVKMVVQLHVVTNVVLRFKTPVDVTAFTHTILYKKGSNWSVMLHIVLCLPPSGPQPRC